MSEFNIIRKRALVIEDEPIIGRVCRKVLNTHGFDVDIALNGLIAKDMSGKNIYDLCISDIRTPEMNGIEFYYYLKKEHPTLADRVILTTGDVLNSDVKRFLKEFKGTFLPKPFTPEELIKAVGEVQAYCIA